MTRFYGPFFHGYGIALFKERLRLEYEKLKLVGLWKFRFKTPKIAEKKFDLRTDFLLACICPHNIQISSFILSKLKLEPKSSQSDFSSLETQYLNIQSLFSIASFDLKQNDFNGDTLSDAVTDFFHIFVIVLLVECEKFGRPHLTVSPLNSSAFKKLFLHQVLL